MISRYATKRRENFGQRKQLEKLKLMELESERSKHPFYSSRHAQSWSGELTVFCSVTEHGIWQLFGSVMPFNSVNLTAVSCHICCSVIFPSYCEQHVRSSVKLQQSVDQVSGNVNDSTVIEAVPFHGFFQAVARVQVRKNRPQKFRSPWSSLNFAAECFCLSPPDPALHTAVQSDLFCFRPLRCPRS